MLFVARHGQTDWNVEHKVQGQADIALNTTGIKQAYQLKESLSSYPLHWIISSPLLRAQKTAQIIADNRIPIIIDKRLMERDFGEFEGLFKTDFDISSFWNYEKDMHYQKAENVRDLLSRVYDFLSEYQSIYETKNVLLITHAGIIPVISCYFNGIPKDSNIFTHHKENGGFLIFHS